MNIIDSALLLVSNIMKDNDASHDVQHVKRVVALSLLLADHEGITDPDTIEIIHLAAILHDCLDHKYGGPSEINSIHKLFQEHDYPQDKRDRILHVLYNVGYSSEIKRMKVDRISYRDESGNILFVERDPMYHTDELCIVQDADRIEALGSIGIARCLFFAASHGGLIYNKDTGNTAIDHFYDKLFKLEFLMKTTKGRELASERTKIMKLFVSSLQEEWCV